MLPKKSILFLCLYLVINFEVIGQKKDSAASIELQKNTLKKKPCPVDSHGVSLDTDGDGVPDCIDKEIITSQFCFPVDSTGKGMCPEPVCCADARPNGMICYFLCSIESLPSIHFTQKNSLLTSPIKSQLDSLAEKLNYNPYCNLLIKAYYKEHNKSSRLLGAKRIKMIIQYLLTKGVSASRLSSRLQDGDGIDSIYFTPFMLN